MSHMPDGWKLSTIGDVADVNPRLSKSDLSDDDSVSFIPMASVSTESGHIDTSDVRPAGPLKMKSYRQFAEGDVLIAKITPSMENGKGAVARGLASCRGFGSTEFHVLRPWGVEADYLLRYMLQQSFRATAARNMTGTAGQLRVPPDYLRNHPIPVPPLAEQRRIVAAIEEHFSRLDAAEASIRVCVTRLEGLVAWALDSAIAKTESWPTALMSDIAQLSLGKMLDRKKQTGEHPTPYLRNINVRWGVFDTTDLAVMDVAPGELDRVTVQAGDVVMCEGGEPGRCAVWKSEQPIAIQKALHRIRLDSRALPEFVVLFFRQLAASGRLARFFTGSTIKHLPKQQLARIAIRIPPLEVQQNIVNEVHAIELEASRLHGTLVQSSVSSTGLRLSILTAAFSGRLVPQDATDEPASMLLERIAAERAAAKTSRKKKRAS